MSNLEYINQLEAQGFEKYHTGGGCMVMQKQMEKAGQYIWVSASDGGDLPCPDYGFMACLYPKDTEDDQLDPIAQFNSDDDDISLADAIQWLIQRADARKEI